MFPHIKQDTIIKSYKNVEYEKGDICIKVGNKIKYISIKMGHKNSVHCESIEKFKKFLKSINVDENIIKEILKYQYGDGTLNGTGEIRKSAAEYKLENQKSIDIINQEINKPEILKKVINRFIIQGTQWQTHHINLLVYGTPDDFLFITPNEIYAYILSKKDIQSSALHFSCLTFQPMSRVLNYNEKMEYMRHWIQIKWYNLEDNIIELMNLKEQKLLNN
ncbi:MAG: hypothetical protein IJY25_01950 [Bacilli bacterium]|nr:hypothetical protein [Bacilli bacterium]